MLPLPEFEIGKLYKLTDFAKTFNVLEFDLVGGEEFWVAVDLTSNSSEKNLFFLCLGLCDQRPLNNGTYVRAVEMLFKGKRVLVRESDYDLLEEAKCKK